MKILQDPSLHRLDYATHPDIERRRRRLKSRMSELGEIAIALAGFLIIVAITLLALWILLVLLFRVAG